MNVSFGNIVKLNLPDMARNKIKTKCSYSGFSQKPDVLKTLGNLKGDELSSRAIQFLISDSSKQSDKSEHTFVLVDGELFMLSGPDYDDYVKLRKTAIERICDTDNSCDGDYVSEIIDDVELSNPLSSVIQNLYRETLRVRIKDNPNIGKLDIVATPDGYISKMAYNSKQFKFRFGSK